MPLPLLPSLLAPIPFWIRLRKSSSIESVNLLSISPHIEKALPGKREANGNGGVVFSGQE
jgi:hypothetical protein